VARGCAPWISTIGLPLPKKELEKMQEKIQLSYARPPKKQFLLPSEKKENYPKEMRLKCLSV